MPSIRTTTRTLAIVGAVLALSIPVCCLGVWLIFPWPFLGVDDTGDPHVSPAQQQKAAAYLRTTFPPSTRFCYYHLEGFQDLFLAVKVELPVGDVTDLLEASPFKGAKFDSRIESGNSHLWKQGFSDFEPSEITRYRCAEVDQTATHHYQILIDESNADTSVVYLIYMKN